MTIIEIGARREEVSQRQRWSHYFALIFGVVALVIGTNLRDGALFASTLYTDTRAGIRAFYPQNWLIETETDEFIFRVRDMSQTGFKTTIQVSAVPIGAATESRNILEALSLSRMQTLAEYSIISIDTYALPDEPDATAMEYAFAFSEEAPFLESLPAVVRGLDVMAVRRGQAIVITFLSDASTYAQNLPVFEQFLVDLEF